VATVDVTLNPVIDREVNEELVDAVFDVVMIAGELVNPIFDVVIAEEVIGDVVIGGRSKYGIR